MMAERETGTVKWFSPTEGYGFIARDKGGDLFVHFTGIRGERRNLLKQSLRVEFTVIREEKGPRAQDVVVVD